MGKILRKEKEHWNIIKVKVKTRNIKENKCFTSNESS